MSKGYSGLFKNTLGHKLSTNSLRDKAINAVKKLILSMPKGTSKAMAVGAYDIKTGKIATAFAGTVPKKIHPVLLEKVKRIGEIGTHALSDKNILGVCAEFRAVNRLLYKGSKWEDIRLTPAIRPRTGESRAYCENCAALFYDIIN